MLPFLNPKKSAAVIIAKRQESGAIKTEGEANEPSPEAVACAERILAAIANKDAKALAAELSEVSDE